MFTLKYTSKNFASLSLTHGGMRDHVRLVIVSGTGWTRKKCNVEIKLVERRISSTWTPWN